MKSEEKPQASPGRVYDLEERLINFAVQVLSVVEEMPNGRPSSHIGGQLARCGTSPAPNYGEAQSSESRNDFIHKMKVCLNELRETRVWLLIVQRKGLLQAHDNLQAVLGECNELIAIF